MEITIHIDTKSSGRLYFLDLDSMFKFVAENQNDVIGGYIGC